MLKCFSTATKTLHHILKIDNYILGSFASRSNSPTFTPHHLIQLLVPGIDGTLMSPDEFQNYTPMPTVLWLKAQKSEFYTMSFNTAARYKHLWYPDEFQNYTPMPTILWLPGQQSEFYAMSFNTAARYRYLW